MNTHLTRISPSVGKRHSHYYSLNYQKEKTKYCPTFPVEWALSDSFTEPFHNEIKGNRFIGSICCENCKKHGTIHGIFVQYCQSCASVTERPGCACCLRDMLPAYRLKVNGRHGKLIGYPCRNKKCIFRTYLKNVDLNFLLPTK